jgi:hypothetical protein
LLALLEVAEDFLFLSQGKQGEDGCVEHWELAGPRVSDCPEDEEVCTLRTHVELGFHEAFKFGVMKLSEL